MSRIEIRPAFGEHALMLSFDSKEIQYRNKILPNKALGKLWSFLGKAAKLDENDKHYVKFNKLASTLIELSKDKFNTQDQKDIKQAKHVFLKQLKVQKKKLGKKFAKDGATIIAKAFEDAFADLISHSNKASSPVLFPSGTPSTIHPQTPKPKVPKAPIVVRKGVPLNKRHLLNKNNPSLENPTSMENQQPSVDENLVNNKEENETETKTIDIPEKIKEFNEKNKFEGQDNSNENNAIFKMTKDELRAAIHSLGAFLPKSVICHQKGSEEIDIEQTLKRLEKLTSAEVAYIFSQGEIYSDSYDKLRDFILKNFHPSNIGSIEQFKKEYTNLLEANEKTNFNIRDRQYPGVIKKIGQTNNHSLIDMFNHLGANIEKNDKERFLNYVKNELESYFSEKNDQKPSHKQLIPKHLIKYNPTTKQVDIDKTLDNLKDLKPEDVAIIFMGSSIYKKENDNLRNFILTHNQQKKMPNKTEVIKILKQNGSNEEALYGTYEDVPLVNAAKTNNIFLVETLIAAGCSTEQSNHIFQTPVQIAAKNNNMSM